MEEWVAANLAAAPPLSPEQIRKLSGLLNTGHREPVPYIPEPRPETPEEREQRLIRELDQRLSWCATCGIEKDRHGFPEHFGYIGHSHTPYSLADRKRITEEFVERFESNLEGEQ